MNAEGTPRCYDALNVIAAPGNYQIPYIPDFAQHLGPEVKQLRVGTYKGPAMVSDGAVLVVGGGQSGVQISEELARAGRRVYLATSRVKGTPRTYRGEDILFWLDRTGVLAELTAMLSRQDGYDESMPIVGHDHAMSHASLAELGVTLLGRLLRISSDGRTATFSDDLRANVAFAQQGYRETIDQLDAWVANSRTCGHAPYPERTAEAAWEASFTAISPPCLDLLECGVRTVVWATGWRVDLGWLHIPEVCQALNAHGLPETCETPVEGFLWLGFHWLRTRSSGAGCGFHLDASYVATKLRSL